MSVIDNIFDMEELNEKLRELKYNKTPQGKKAYMKLKLRKKLAEDRLNEKTSIIQKIRDINGNIITKKAKRSLSIIHSEEK